jgi:hypothetical protein
MVRFKLSIALVVVAILRIAGSKAKNEITSCQAHRQAEVTGAYFPAHFPSKAFSLTAAWSAVAAP